jgi:hypothetical protein
MPNFDITPSTWTDVDKLTKVKMVATELEMEITIERNELATQFQ